MRKLLSIDLSGLLKKGLLGQLENAAKAVLRKYMDRAPNLTLRIFVSENLLPQGVNRDAWARETEEHLRGWSAVWAEDNGVKWTDPRVQIVVLDTVLGKILAQAVELPKGSAATPVVRTPSHQGASPGRSIAVEAILEFVDARRMPIRIRAEATLGRPGQPGVVPIDDSHVSKQHARLRILGDTLLISDLGSTNGTLVNGVPLLKGEERQLVARDLIEVGRTRLRLQSLYSI